MTQVLEQQPDPRESTRAAFLRVGQLPMLEAKSIVWVLYGGNWQKARIRRRVAGSVYMAEMITYPCNGTLVAVSAFTYGGMVAPAR